MTGEKAGNLQQGGKNYPRADGDCEARQPKDAQSYVNQHAPHILRNRRRLLMYGDIQAVHIKNEQPGAEGSQGCSEELLICS